jgi:hypothetical protein
MLYERQFLLNQLECVARRRILEDATTIRRSDRTFGRAVDVPNSSMLWLLIMSHPVVQRLQRLCLEPRRNTQTRQVSISSSTVLECKTCARVFQKRRGNGNHGRRAFEVGIVDLLSHVDSTAGTYRANFFAVCTQISFGNVFCCQGQV